MASRLLFAINRPVLPGDMLRVETLQTVMGQLSEPGIKRNGSSLEVGRKPLEGYKQGFLHHIRRVDAGRESGIESDRNHFS